VILLFTNSSDEHADVVQPMLEAIGYPSYRFNVDDWQRNTLAFYPSSAAGFFQLISPDGITKFTSDDVTAVWYRRPHDPKQLAEPRSRSDEFANGEWKHSLDSLYGALKDCFWVNSLDSMRIANSKPYQLHAAHKHGFSTPRTIITNNPQEVQDFAKTFEGPLAYKPLHSFSTSAGSGNELLTIFTNVISRDLLKTCAAQIQRAPCLFQEYVTKKYELRITVVGKDVHCAAIHSQASERSSVDWRRYDLANTPYEPYPLPAAFRTEVIEFVRSLGLVFGCLDFIVTPDDKYVFLEINTNGQWLWIERLTKLPIAESITHLLARAGRLQCTAPLDQVVFG